MGRCGFLFSFLRTEFVLPVEKTLDKAILSVTSKTTGASKGGEKTRQYVYFFTAR